MPQNESMPATVPPDDSFAAGDVGPDENTEDEGVSAVQQVQGDTQQAAATVRDDRA